MCGGIVLLRSRRGAVLGLFSDELQGFALNLQIINLAGTVKRNAFNNLDILRYGQFTDSL